MSRLSLTDVLAVWGAVVASFVAGWNIFRDVIQRDRLQVHVSPMKIYPGGADVFSWTITNVGRNDMYVTHLCGSQVRRQSWPIKQIARLVRWKQSGQSFVFPFQYMPGSLPTKIEPRNSVAFHYDLSKLGLPPSLDRFFAISADNRHWHAPRSDVKRTLANADYQKHAKPRPVAKDG